MRIAPIAFALTLIATGCTAPETSTAAPIAAEQTCAELSDVGTLVANLRFAESEGRLAGNEYSGAMRLAARMLARVPVESDTALAEVVSALQGAAPAAVLGAASSVGVDPAATDWVESWARVQDACNEAMGVTDVLGGFGIEGWVGG
jgi:hypothetical protein